MSDKPEMSPISALFETHIIRGYKNATLNKLSSLISVINHRQYLDLFYRTLNDSTDEFEYVRGQKLGALILVGAYHEYNEHDDTLTCPLIEIGMFRMLFPEKGKWGFERATFTLNEIAEMKQVLDELIKDHATIEISARPLHELVSDTEL